MMGELDGCCIAICEWLKGDSESLQAGINKTEWPDAARQLCAASTGQAPALKQLP